MNPKVERLDPKTLAGVSSSFGAVRAKRATP
jgi:hypothetical protein